MLARGGGQVRWPEAVVPRSSGAKKHQAHTFTLRSRMMVGAPLA